MAEEVDLLLGRHALRRQRANDVARAEAGLRFRPDALDTHRPSPELNRERRLPVHGVEAQEAHDGEQPVSRENEAQAHA